MPDVTVPHMSESGLCLLLELRDDASTPHRFAEVRVDAGIEVDNDWFGFPSSRPIAISSLHNYLPKTRK